MKNLMLTTLLLLGSVCAQAKDIASTKLAIAPSSVYKMIRLVENGEPGSSQKKLSIIVADKGMSTDMSPRFTVYLGFASMAEMGNISADFKINEQTARFVSASRKEAGIYEVKVVEYRDDGMYLVTQTINAKKTFIDERQLRKSCGVDFCDQTLNTTVSVSETASKMN